MKLWNKNQTSMAESVEKFTVGNDKIFDILLAKQDFIGSLAHTEMLQHIGILSTEELFAVEKALDIILQKIINNNFKIDDDVEDVHSQIEMMLTEMIGDAGKKFIPGVVEMTR